MNDSIRNFPEAHRALLELFKEVRKAPANTAASLVRGRLQTLRNQLIASKDEAAYLAYESYLAYYAKRLSDSSMCDLLTLVDPKKIETVLSKDPSRYDQLLCLARYYLTQNRRNEARLVLKKVAASRFSEAKEAQSLLERLVDESLK